MGTISGLAKARIRIPPRQKTKQTMTMPIKGINLKDLQQLLDPSQASLIKNYTVEGIAQLVKRKGSKKIFEVAGGATITMFRKFTTDVYMFAYATTLATFTKSTNIVTTLKSDFAATITDGLKYGGFFLTCNSVNGDKIYRTPLSTLIPAEITNAPKCETLYSFESRLLAGNTDTDTTEIHASVVDNGTDPPFDIWTVGLNASDPFKIRYRVAGDVKSISSLGQQVVILYEDGRAAFRITSLDLGGTLTLDTPISFQQIDFGGFRGAATTPKGTFFVNETGIWQWISVGQTNTPFSENIVETSLLLGVDFFDDISFLNADIVYDEKRNKVLVTARLDSSTNNIIFVYDLDTQAFTFFTGLNISRFLKDGSMIFGADDRKTVAYQLFEGHDDDGEDIYHEYIQEVQINDFDRLSNMNRFFMQSSVSESTNLGVHFDTFDRKGNETKSKVKLQFPTQGASTGSVGVGSAPISTSGLTALGRGSGTTTLIAQTRDDVVIPEIWRLVVHIKGNDKVPHTVNLFTVTTEDRNELINLNNFTSF